MPYMVYDKEVDMNYKKLLCFRIELFFFTLGFCAATSLIGESVANTGPGMDVGSIEFKPINRHPVDRGHKKYANNSIEIDANGRLIGTYYYPKDRNSEENASLSGGGIRVPELAWGDNHSYITTRPEIIENKDNTIRYQTVDRPVRARKFDILKTIENYNKKHETEQDKAIFSISSVPVSGTGLTKYTICIQAGWFLPYPKEDTRIKGRDFPIADTYFHLDQKNLVSLWGPAHDEVEIVQGQENMLMQSLGKDRGGPLKFCYTIYYNPEAPAKQK